MTAYFKMRGVDPDCQTLTYREWIVANKPDPDGSLYTSTRCGVSSLTKITVIDSWNDDLEKSNTIADLRALPKPTFSINLFLRGHSADGDGGEGNFYWNATSTETDNGGTIIQPNAGGTGRWKRLFSGPIYVNWFGADNTGVASSSAALQAAHDALPSFGGVLYLAPGTYKIGNVTFTKPVKLILDGASIVGTANPIITVSGSNFSVTGTDRVSSTITTFAGGAVFILNNSFAGALSGGTGQPHFIIENLALYGTGASNECVFDNTIVRSPVLKFFEGTCRIKGCLISGFGGTAFSFGIGTDGLANPSYFNVVEDCYFTGNYGAVYAGDNSDTWIMRCVMYQGANGIAQIRAVGPDVHIIDTFMTGNAGTTEPDIDLIPVNSISDGWVWITNCRFGTEGERWNPLRARVRCKNQADLTKIFGPLKMLGCMVLGPGFNTVLSVVRSSNVTTITLYAAHGCAIGTSKKPIFRIFDISDPTFCGEYECTPTGTNTLTYANPGSNASLSSGSGIGNCALTNQAVIELDNPISHWDISHNEFHGFGFGCNDNQNPVVDLLDHCGKSIWRDNSMTFSGHFAGETFVNGGRQFELASRPQAGMVSFSPDPRETETIGLENRIASSDDLTHASWAASSGVTVTFGSTDPWGGSRASHISRDGTAANQNVRCFADTTGWSGNQNFNISFWVKADTAINLTFEMNDGSNVIEVRQIKITSDWLRVRIPIRGLGNGKTPGLQFVPNGSDAVSGSLYLSRIALSNDNSDPVPTNGSVSTLSKTTGVRFERLGASRIFGSPQAEGTPVLSGGTGLGTGGGYSLEAGSTDLAGYIEIDIGSTDGGNNGSIVITWAKPFPGTAPPVIIPTLIDAFGRWDKQSVIHVYTINQLSVTLLWSNNGVNLDHTAGFVRIGYVAIGRY